MAEFASKGVANAGLTTGIIGTALGVMNSGGCGNGLLGNLLGGGNCCNNANAAHMMAGQAMNYFENKEAANLREQVATLTAEKYADNVGIQVYKEAMAASNKNDERLNLTLKEAAQELVVTRERLARNEEQFKCLVAQVSENTGKINKLEEETCAARVREAQTLKDVECLAASVTQKIDALRNETSAAIALEGERRVNGDNNIMCHVKACYVPGELVMPLSRLCPEAMPRYNSYVTPTNQAPDTVSVNMTSGSNCRK